MSRYLVSKNGDGARGSIPTRRLGTGSQATSHSVSEFVSALRPAFKPHRKIAARHSQPAYRVVGREHDRPGTSRRASAEGRPRPLRSGLRLIATHRQRDRCRIGGAWFRVTKRRVKADRMTPASPYRVSSIRLCRGSLRLPKGSGHGLAAAGQAMPSPLGPKVQAAVL